MQERINKVFRTDLSLFIQKTFSIVDPGTEYLHNWHVDVIAEYLKACKQGEIKRLIINIPPRSLKSISVSVAFPAFLLGHNASTHIMVASYSQALSLTHSVHTRRVIQSEWYKQLFPDTEISSDQATKTKFMTTKLGFRMATSVGGTATGEGGDFLIVDDPHNVLEAQSEVKRQTALDWFDQTFSTRLNNKKEGVIIIIMQRLHEMDLTGHLKEKGGYEHLCLPIVAEKKQAIYLLGKEKKVREEGELLHPEREGLEELNKIKIALGEYGYAGQYQQRPAPLGGGMIKMDWFKRFKTQPDKQEVIKIIQSWDTALTANTGSDYSVCTTWLQTDKGYFWIDTYRAKLEFPELKRMCISLAMQYNPHVVLIEDKGSGQSLLQELRNEPTINALPIKPVGDKIVRMSAASPAIEAGKVYMPEKAAWLPDATNELMQFPNGSHDDIVDSVSQCLNWIRLKRDANPRISML
jgi:predicted phage terminase large subunit-like protein